MSIQVQPPGAGRAATLRAVAGNASLDPARLGVPDNPIALPPGHLACLWCGVAVWKGNQTPIVVEATAREGQPPRAPRPPGYPLDTCTTEFLTCPDCLRRTAAAGELLHAHPRVRNRIGGESVALYQVSCALAALALLGHDLSTSALPESGLLSMLRHLSAPGASARWMTKFAPLLLATSMPRTCNPYPWAHVRGVLRLRLREGYAAVLEDRVALSAPPVALPPPPLASTSGQVVAVGGACLLCGTAVVRLPAAQTLALGGREVASKVVWSVMTTASASLGGIASPEKIVGHSCPPCADALASVGAVGATAMECAFIAHLRSTGRTAEADRLRLFDVGGLVGWGALAYDAHRRGGRALAPNAVPWGHIRLPD